MKVLHLVHLVKHKKTDETIDATDRYMAILSVTDKIKLKKVINFAIESKTPIFDQEYLKKMIESIDDPQRVQLE